MDIQSGFERNSEGILVPEEMGLSKKAGLYLPGDMAFRYDHPFLASVKDRAGDIGKTAGALAVSSVIATTPILADTSQTQNPNFNFFGGVILAGSDKEYDSIFDLTHNPTGARLVME